MACAMIVLSIATLTAANKQGDHLLMTNVVQLWVKDFVRRR